MSVLRHLEYISVHGRCNVSQYPCIKVPYTIYQNSVVLRQEKTKLHYKHHVQIFYFK
jgi:hypothetical protein